MKSTTLQKLRDQHAELSTSPQFIADALLFLCEQIEELQAKVERRKLHHGAQTSGARAYRKFVAEQSKHGHTMKEIGKRWKALTPKQKLAYIENHKNA